MLYMLTVNRNQYGGYTTRANAVAALTDLRAEGVEGEAEIKQIDYDHDSRLAKRWEVYPWLRGGEIRMKPPFKVELWKPVHDTPHLLAVTESFEAAEKAYQEAEANLRVGEVVRVRDALGTLLLSTDEEDFFMD